MATNNQTAAATGSADHTSSVTQAQTPSPTDAELEESLRQQIKLADQQLAELKENKRLVDRHIQVLHDYNEIKDVVQALLGKCAEMEGRTTKDMYEKFGLDLED